MRKRNMLGYFHHPTIIQWVGSLTWVFLFVYFNHYMIIGQAQREW